MFSASPMAPPGIEPDALADGIQALTESTPYDAVPVSVDLGGKPATQHQSIDGKEARRLATPPHEFALLQPRAEIVFVDTGAENHQQLIEDLLTNSGQGRTLDVHLLDGSRDGVEQISQILQGYSGVDAIHLVSHGSDGRINLGDVWLGVENLNRYAGELAGWNNALSQGADMLLYGCDLASSARGQAFAEALSTICDCDVAASIDDTGNTERGGDWELEYAIGSIQTEIAFSATLQQQWQGLLAPAPGGIEADLQLWLRADAGVTSAVGGVNQWDNQVANPTLPNVQQSTSGERPDLVAGALNFNPVISFNDAAEDDLRDASVLGSDLFSPDKTSIFVVARLNSGTVIAQWREAGTNRVNIEGSQPRFDFGDQSNDSITGTGWGSGYHILNTQASPGSPALMEIYVDGALHTSGNASVNSPVDDTATGSFRIGEFPSAPPNFNANMDLAEVIIYKSDLSANDRLRVESYLAMKYGITIDQTSATNYLDSTGATIWDAAANSGYDNDLAGIGQDDGSTLDQTRSRSINADSILTVSAASSQDHGDFLMWGNDNGALTETATGNPVDITQRLQRIWRVDEAGDIGTTTIEFDLTGLTYTGSSASEFNLIVDTDTSFGSGATTTSAANFNAGTEIVTFTGIDLADAEFFTLGTMANTHQISGTVYEDIDADGAVLDDNVAVAGATVSLYLDNGGTSGQIDGTDSFVGTTTTDGSGNYSFSGLGNNTYWVVVDAKTVGPSAGFNATYGQTDVWAEQTYGSAGAVSFNGGYSYLGAAGAFYGGMQGEVSDDAAALTTAEHVTRVVVSGSNVANIDHGFSFDAVTRTGDGDDDLGANRTVQGSLRQFFQNANAIDNTLHGVNTSRFAIPTTDSNYNVAGNSEFRIQLASLLPAISDSVVLDGENHPSFAGTPIIEIDGTNGASPALAGDGLTIDGTAAGSTIRGLAIYGFNGDGIDIDGGSNVTVEGSYIGTNSGGTLNLGNSGDGIAIHSGATGNTIGGVAATDGNRIVFSGGDGVRILSGTGNAVLGNVIHSNVELGIDLASNNVTANDTNDLDGGPNLEQNFPVLARAMTDGSQVTISGFLNSESGVETYRLEFFASHDLDGLGHGEGEIFLGFANVTTDAAGIAQFQETFVLDVAPGLWISATATDSTNNTSEFSTSITAISPITYRSEFAVNDQTSSTQETSSEDRGSTRSVAIAPDGNKIVVWSSLNQDLSGWGVYGELYDADGNLLRSEFPINNTTTNDQRWASVAMDHNGRFVVVWSGNGPGDSTGIFYRRFDATGAAVDLNDVRVNTTTNLTQDNASVAMDANGDFIVVWEGNGEQAGNVDSNGVFGQLIQWDGTKIGGEFLVNPVSGSSQKEPSVAMSDNGNFVVVWDDGGGVHGQLYAADGSPIGGRFTADSSGFAGEAAVAMDADGDFVVAWRAGSPSADVYATLYDSAGVEQTPGGFGVSSTTANDQSDPSVDMDGSGNFIIVWEGNGTETENVDTDGVFGRRFLADGTPLSGNEFRVNEVTAGNQQMTSVAMLNLDNFFAVWTGPDANGDGVYARQFGKKTSLNGLLLSTSSDVSDTTANGPIGWGKDDVLTFGGSDFDLEPTTTSGSFGSLSSLDELGDGDVDVDAIHYVTTSISVGGGNAITLNPGDLLLSTADDESFLGDTFSVEDSDVFVFRPVASGDYSAGTFELVIDTSADPDLNFSDLWSITLVEQSVSVGGTFLDAGDFLFSRQGGSEHQDVYVFDVTDVGAGTTDGAVFQLTEGNDIGFSDRIYGLDLVENSINLGGTILSAGTILVTIDDETTVGDNSLSVTRRDLFSLNIIQSAPATTMGNATLLFEGLDVGLTDATEDLNALSIVSGVAANDPPVNTVPGTQSVNEEIQTPIPGISISDVDAGLGLVTTRLQVTAGVLDVVLAGAATISAGLNSSSDMTIQGTVADINGTLASVQYTGNMDVVGTNADTLTVTTNDGGNSGSGGPMQDVDLVQIDITAQNDPPVNTVPGTRTVDEETQTAIAGVSISDVDAAAGLVTTRLQVVNGVLDVVLSGAATISSGTNGTADLTVQGNVTDVNNTLTSLQYTGDMDVVGISADLLTVTTNDGGNTGSGGPRQDIDVVQIDITAQNDPPVNTVPGTQSVDEETQTPIAGISISDADAAAGQVTMRLQVMAGTLDVVLAGAATISAGTNGTADLTVQGTVADVNATLASVQYTGNMDVVGVNADTLTVTTNDGGNSGAGGPLQDVDAVQIDIGDVNDPPQVTTPAFLSPAEDIPFVVAGISVSDVDAGANDIQLILDVSNASLTVNDSVAGGLSAVDISNNGTNNIVLTGTVNQINTTLADAAGLVYLGSLHFNGADVLTVTANDQGHTGIGPVGSDSQTVGIDVSAVNDQPIGGADKYAMAADTTLVVAAKGVLRNDRDVEGSVLTAVLVAGPTSGIVALNPDGSFTYRPEKGFSGTVTFLYRANDGQLDSNNVAVRITIHPLLILPPPIPPTRVSTPDDDVVADEDDLTTIGILPQVDRIETVDTVERVRQRISTRQVGELNRPPVGVNNDPAPRASFADLGFANTVSYESHWEPASAVQSTVSMASMSDLENFDFIVGPGGFWNDLDDLKELVDSESHVTHIVAGQAATFTSMLTAGYVLWTIRGGYLLTSLLAQMPAWQIVNPLLVLDYDDDLEDDPEDEDDQNADHRVERMFEGAKG